MGGIGKNHFIALCAFNFRNAVDPVLAGVGIVQKIAVIGHGFNAEPQFEVPGQVEFACSKKIGTRRVRVKVVICHRSFKFQFALFQQLAISVFERSCLGGEKWRQKQILVISDGNKIGNSRPGSQKRGIVKRRHKKTRCSVKGWVRRAKSRQIGHGNVKNSQMGVLVVYLPLLGIMSHAPHPNNPKRWFSRFANAA